jgi:hypothetical protein
MEKHEFAKIYHETRNLSIKKIRKCYFPNCKNQPINSHILQKNGILNRLAVNNHLWEKAINQFKDQPFYFKRTGINEIYSFDCFCKEHDDKLFKKIEQNIVDFNDYHSCLLFTLRTIYNELWRKEINIEQYKLMIEKGVFPGYKKVIIEETIKQEKLGISDIRKFENDIWEDINTGTENFIFNHRKLNKIDICLSALYNYETTMEMHQYRLLHGKDMERITTVFANLFPYDDNSVLLMGYNKKDESKIKPYFNTFFKNSEKKVETQITNMLMFTTETWVISESLYKTKIKHVEDIFISAINYSIDNNNEREFFKVNIFNDNYISDMNRIKRYFC